MRRRWIRFRAGAVLLACLALLAGAAEQAVTTKSLEGTWSGARFGEGKGENPEEGVKLELTFAGDKIVGKRVPSGKDIGEGSFKLSGDGKTIDASGSTGYFKGKGYLGIVKIEGDTLYWCTGTKEQDQKRPTEFAASPTEQSYLIIVKRQKK